MAQVNLKTTWQTLSPADKDKTYFHNSGAADGITALALKVRATGGKAWFFEYGKGKRVTLGSPDARGDKPGMTYEQADRERAIAIARLKQGEPAQAPVGLIARPGGGLTVSDLIDNYLKMSLGAKQLRPAYIGRIKRRMELLRRAWGSKGADDMTPSDVTAFFDQYQDRPGMQQDLWVAAKMLFKFAKGRGEIATNPMRELDPRGKSVPRERHLTEEELAKLLPVLRTTPYPDGPALMLALLLARRISEVTDAEWAEIDLERGVWTIPGSRTKNHKPHALPLVGTALALLRDAATRKVGPGRYVFHLDDDRPISVGGHHMERIRKTVIDRQAPIEHWTRHDLRRTTIGIMHRMQFPLDIAYYIPAHSMKDLGIHFRNYANRTPTLDDVAPWLTKLDQYYQTLVPLALPAPSAAA